MRTFSLLMGLSLAACDSGSDDVADGGAADVLVVDAARPDRGFSGLDGGAGVGPEIDVTPAVLQLLGAAGQTSDPVTATVRNVGTEPLEVSQARTTGAGFELVDPPTWPVVVAPGDELALGVAYTPPGAGRHEGTLDITSDDADEAMVRVPLVGRVEMSCLRAMPSTINLGAVEPGSDSGRFQAQLINCGDVAIGIGAVTREGDEGFHFEVEGAATLAESELLPGQSVRLQFWYQNDGLAPDEEVTGAVVLETDAARTPELRINLRARGGGGPSCRLTVSPARVDFEFVRVGLTRAIEVQVDNPGTDICLLNDIRIEDMDGPEENTFTVTRGLPMGEIAANSEQRIEVTYAPTVAFPPGDRVRLRVEFHDPHTEQNRTEEALLRGVGAEALVAAMPDETYFGEVTAPGCASPRFRVRADNAGFVPMCLTGFRFEGDECDRFVTLEAPEIEDDCLWLEPEDFSEFLFQYEPTELRGEGRDRCDLIVESDAMNFPELGVPLTGSPVVGPETVDDLEVGRLNAERAAYFRLRRPAVEETVAVWVDDEANEDWEWDQGRNSIFFARGDHPDRGAALRIEYDAICFDRAGD